MIEGSNAGSIPPDLDKSSSSSGEMGVFGLMLRTVGIGNA